MAPQASEKCSLLPPNQLTTHIASCTSNGINQEKVPRTFPVLKISSLFLQTSAQSEKREVAPEI
jgi:hypothetical protein